MTDPERLSERDLAWLEQLDRELTAELAARSADPVEPLPGRPAPPPALRWTAWPASFGLLALVCGVLAAAAATSSVLWTAATILLMPTVVLPFLWEERRRGR